MISAAAGSRIALRVLAVCTLLLAIAVWGVLDDRMGWLCLRAFQIGLVAFAIWRLLLIFLSRRRAEDLTSPDVLPAYTVMAALYQEAAILPQLVERLDALDYPRDRLEGFLLLEEGDTETIAVARSLRLPAWLSVVIVPKGSPQTKPRALNHGLSLARGQLLTIYDAEDAPDPMQLREAAARFHADPQNLGCLQAPLRIRRLYAPAVPTPVLDRQFACEYAGLFEVVLPGMARLGLPFPLGGTSNHFRVDALRAVGGWDAHNVTEDADLGFRLWQQGWRLGVMVRPTWETPPGPMKLWLPQRTRWLKGHLQTLAVHAFSRGLGWRGHLSLTASLFAGLLSASIHGFALASLGAVCLLAFGAFRMPPLDLGIMAVTVSGYMAAWLTAWTGSRRMGIPYGWRDMAVAPVYWSLMTLAFAHALMRLVVQPHIWDKTPHLPDIPLPDQHTPVVTARYSSAGAGRKAA